MNPDDSLKPDIRKDGTKDELYPDTPPVFICPECGGALWQVEHGDQFRFRCHLGHAFTGASLLAGQERNVEEALWSALRGLDENAGLNRRMAEKARARNRDGLFLAYTGKAKSRRGTGPGDSEPCCLRRFLPQV